MWAAVREDELLAFVLVWIRVLLTYISRSLELLLS